MGCHISSGRASRAYEPAEGGDAGGKLPALLTASVPSEEKEKLDGATVGMAVASRGSSCASSFHGTHADIRSLLDYTWHIKYSAERVEVQDKIIEEFCRKSQSHRRDLLPRVVFTAGAMGAGKGYITKWMEKEGYLPLDRCVMVDPDQIRQMLPEWQALVQEDAENAGRRTQKEAGSIAEILGYKALRYRFDVIFDGSLRDSSWYVNYFQKLREKFPGIRIIILHITADREEVLERAAKRAEQTGRVVPRSVLLESMEAVPQSVAALSPYADFVCRIHNSGSKEPRLEREPAAPFPPASVQMSWSLLAKLWKDVDSNGDGELCADEVVHAVEIGVLTSRVVETMDLDGDGAISQQEVAVARAKARLSTASKFKISPLDIIPEEQPIKIKVSCAVKKAVCLNHLAN